QGLGHAPAGELTDVEPGPALAHRSAPVGAMLVCHPDQTDAPTGIEARAQRGRAPGAAEQVLVGLVEDLLRHDMISQRRPVGEPAEAPRPRTGMVEPRQDST